MSEPRVSLTSRTTYAAQWRFAGSAIGAVSQFGVGILLARLLPPADFGLIALAFVIVGLLRPSGDLGIGNAIIQQKWLSDRHVRVGFTASMFFGAAVSSVLILLAPLAALIMRDSRVTQIIRVLSLSFLIQAPGVVANGMLRRKLDFRRVFIIETGSYLLGYGAVAITMALLRQGVWSLVFGGLIQCLLASTLFLLTVRHSVVPLYSKTEFNELVHFGVGASLNSTMNYVALNADNFIVGRWMGVGSLGLYNRAYSLMSLPHTYGASAISSVLFPALSEVQGDVIRLRRAYLLATRFTALLSGCAMATLGTAAPEIIEGLYGRKWSGAIVPLQILCLAGYFRALYHLGGAMIQSGGKVYREARCQMIYATLVLLGTYVGTHYYGLRGVAIGVGIAIFYMFFAIGQLALHLTGLTWTAYIRAQSGGIVASAFTGFIVYTMHISLVPVPIRLIWKAGLLLITAAITSAISIAWYLGGVEFEGMRNALPVTVANSFKRFRSVFHLSKPRCSS